MCYPKNNPGNHTSPSVIKVSNWMAAEEQLCLLVPQCFPRITKGINAALLRKGHLAENIPLAVKTSSLTHFNLLYLNSADFLVRLTKIYMR